MAPENPDKHSVQEQARYWLARQHSGDFTPAESRDFEQWLGSNSAHRTEYTRLAGLWRNLDEFKSSSFPARAAARNYRPRAKTVWFPPLQLAAGLGLGLVIVIGLVAGEQLWLNPTAELYQTPKGAQKDIALADGTQVELNTDTTLRVEYSRRGRTVRLESGEAMFTVNHDDKRPFDVIAGAGRIRDIGTSFNVYKHPDAAVSVIVREGAVSVTTDRTGPTELIQGDRLSYTAQGVMSARDRIDPAAAGAWREGKIVFARTPLEDAMAQMARYHEIEFAFASPELRQLKLSGTFGTRDLPLFLHTLAATLPVKARLEGKLVQLASAHTPAPEL